ncbi:hypothetical protein [Jonesia quinghaiensis]|uniref:hypothetical protein n=1 Tax=Jonesia quinghaiensis TaxID=262806 RepID=UPI0004218F78|nr:hypothetical protein [Jonesia quinghaiensis]
MGPRSTQRTALLAAAGAAVLALGTPAAAHAATITSGHIDIVEIECVNGDYEVGAHVGDTHVHGDEIGDYNFIIDRSSSGGYVTYSSALDRYRVTGGGNADDYIPDFGFAYEATGAGCASTLTVNWATTGPGSVTFNGGTAVTLSQNSHTHGTWVYNGATSGTTAYDYTINFSVPTAGEGVGPVNVRVQP